MKIGLIDYGMGNLLSVSNALDYLGADVIEVSNPDHLSSADKLVLPGVGAFADCMRNLHKFNFVAALTDEVKAKKKSILGICLGMQVMAQRGHEGGVHQGLGWIDGEVVSIRETASDLKVPHIGWNNINILREVPIFKGVGEGAEMYFVHSYHMQCRNKDHVAATTEYGGALTAAISFENIYGTQFHPEKSQDLGLKILENFLAA